MMRHGYAQWWTEHTNRRTIIVILLCGAVAIGLYWYVIRPPDNFPIRSLVTIKHGESFAATAEDLERDGVVRSALALRIAVKIFGYERGVRAGDYLFKQPTDLFHVARAISFGAYGLEPMTIRIPEGATTAQMADILAVRLLRFNRDKFMAAAKPLEGYLFPDTYNFLPNASEDAVVEAMHDNFMTKIETLQPLIEKFGKPLNEVVTMASILEKEGIGRNHDREKISTILWSRLSKGMPLQVDATFLYSIGKSTPTLTMADLRSNDPYNTYRNKGLPPTPIGSPSLSSLKAAVTPDPSTSKDLFSLADSYGNTYYSRTYDQHLQYKRLYLQ
jgi:UPF0755 protein